MQVRNLVRVPGSGRGSQVVEFRYGRGFAALRRRLPGYHTATPHTLQRRFLNTGGIIENHRGQITIRLARRTCLPILR